MQGPVGTHHRKFFRRSPTLRPARARRPRPPSGRLRRPSRRCPDVPGPDLAPGNGGSDRELPHIPLHHAGRGPADRTGGECAPGEPSTIRPLRRPPPRHRRRPPPQPHRRTGAGGPVLLRPGRSQLLARRRCDRRTASIATRAPSGGPCAGSRTSGYLRREFTRANPTGRLIHLTCKEPDWPRPVPAPTPVRGAWEGRAPAHGGRAPAPPTET